MTPARRGTRLAFVGALVGVVCTCACGGGDVGVGDVPPGVGYSGCHRVDDGPVCQLEPGSPLTLWNEGALGVPRVQNAGQEMAVVAVEVEGGWQVELVPDAETRWLSVHWPDAPDAGPWELELGWEAPFDLRRRARELPPAEARELFWTEFPTMEPSQVDLALGTWAMIERNDGNSGLAAAIGRRAVALQGEAGHTSAGCRDTGLVADTLLEGGWTAQAREVIETGPGPPAGHLDSQYFGALPRAQLATRTGDVRTAERSYREAAEVARRAGMDALATHAEAGLAHTLQSAGRHRDALALLAAPLAEGRGRGECIHAVFVNDYAWALLLAAHAGRQVELAGDPVIVSLGTDPEALLLQALEVAREDCDPEEFSWHASNIHINLALVYLLDDRLDAAVVELASACLMSPSMRTVEQLWADDIEGRIALRRGDGEAALAAFGRVDEGAVGSGALEFEWRGAAGLGAALALAGREEEALAEYVRAEDLLFEHSFLVPVFLGRETFLDERLRTHREHVALLLGRGRDGDALEAVRRARARYLLGFHLSQRVAGLDDERRAAWEWRLQAYNALRGRMEQRSAGSWSVPATELDSYREELRRLALEAYTVLDEGLAALPPGGDQAHRTPEPGELIVTWIELDEGWVRFATDERSVRVDRLGPRRVVRDDGAEAWALDGLRLEGVRRVTLLPVGPLRALPLHAHLLRADLSDVGPAVVYSLDLPASDERPSQVALERVLLVTDPAGDLAGARGEGAALTGRFHEQGIHATHLDGGAVERAAVLDGLARADLLHYAGHAEAGQLPLDGHLPLAGGESLSVADVLARPSVPPVVVLLACHSADAPPSTVETLGLAQAFLTAGSRAVIAATGSVSDEAAAQFSGAFHEEYARGMDAAVALAYASNRMRAGGSDEWVRFRLIVP